MFSISVIVKTRYKRVPVYVMQFGTCFQYLFILDGELYQDHCFLVPSFLRNALYRTGLAPRPYTDAQMQEGTEAILNGALCSIDELMEPGAKKARRKAREEEERKHAKVRKETSGCTWVAKTNKDAGEMQLWCLEHEKWASMSDEPKHE